MTSISKISKPFIFILSNLSNIHSLKAVNRMSETQLQLGKKSYEITKFKKQIPLFKPRRHIDCRKMKSKNLILSSGNNILKLYHG